MDDSREVASENNSKATRSKAVVWSLTTVAIAVAVVFLVINLVGGDDLPGEEFPSQGNQHISDVGQSHPEYNSDPPTSGWHVGRLARWGSYDYELPDELLIHNMEDGGVIAWYPLGTPEQNRAHIAVLEEMVRGYDRLVIAPRDNLSDEYVLTAWTRMERIPAGDLNERRVREFLEAYEGIDHH